MVAFPYAGTGGGGLSSGTDGFSFRQIYVEGIGTESVLAVGRSGHGAADFKPFRFRPNQLSGTDVSRVRVRRFGGCVSHLLMLVKNWHQAAVIAGNGRLRYHSRYDRFGGLSLPALFVGHGFAYLNFVPHPAGLPDGSFRAPHRFGVMGILYAPRDDRSS